MAKLRDLSEWQDVEKKFNAPKIAKKKAEEEKRLKEEIEKEETDENL